MDCTLLYELGISSHIVHGRMELPVFVTSLGDLKARDIPSHISIFVRQLWKLCCWARRLSGFKWHEEDLVQRCASISASSSAEPTEHAHTGCVNASEATCMSPIISWQECFLWSTDCNSLFTSVCSAGK